MYLHWWYFKIVLVGMPKCLVRTAVCDKQVHWRYELCRLNSRTLTYRQKYHTGTLFVALAVDSPVGAGKWVAAASSVSFKRANSWTLVRAGWTPFKWLSRSWFSANVPWLLIANLYYYDNVIVSRMTTYYITNMAVIFDHRVSGDPHCACARFQSKSKPR